MLFTIVLAVCSATFTAADAYPDSRWEDKLDAVAMLELGRRLTEEERVGMEVETENSVEALAAAIRNGLAAKERASISERAYRDVFGKAAEEDGATRGSYVDRVERFLADLEEDGDRYKAVIDRAYHYVIQRDPYEEEYVYWKERGVFSFVVLVGCVEDWARRNQPGLMVTAGEPTISVNSVYLDTQRVWPDLSESLRAFYGFGEADGGSGYVLTPGADLIATMGPVNFVIIGGMSREPGE